MDQDKVIGYWFAKSDTLAHGDGRKVVVGETLSVEGEIGRCQNGLHWSREPFDALKYASGCLLYKVEASGSIVEQADKGCSRHRKALAVIDATDLLQVFARNQALSVAHLWEMPEVVREFLETGNSGLAADAIDAAAAAAAAAGDAAAAVAAADAAVAAATAAAVGAAAAYAADAGAAAAIAAAVAAARKLFNEMVETAFKVHG